MPKTNNNKCFGGGQKLEPPYNNSLQGFTNTWCSFSINNPDACEKSSKKGYC